MGLSRADAVKRLKMGDCSFVVAAPPERLGELARLDPSAAFYIAIKLAKNPDTADRAELLLSQVALSGTPFVQREAKSFLFERLTGLAGGDGPRDSGRYKEALAIAKDLVAADPSGNDPLARLASLLLGLAAGEKPDRIVSALLDSPVDDSGRLLFEESRRRGVLQGQVVLAFKAREAIARRSYQEALRLFKALLAGDDALFFSHPELIADLGKAFQYGGGLKEGVVLLEAWTRRPECAAGGDPQYRCLFYAARMRRALAGDARGKAAVAAEASAAELWKEALKVAPTPEQSDACLWYLLEMSMDHSSAEAVASMEQLYPLWKDTARVEDLLERLGADLVADRDWKGYLELWRIIRGRCDATTRARSCYILARLLDLGWLEPSAAEPLVPAVEEKTLARRFYRASFEADLSSLYYRCLSAFWLNGGLDPVPSEGPAGERAKEVAGGKPAGKHPELLAFIRGFFDYGSAEYALPRIQRYARTLNPAELALVGSWFVEAGRWGDSIRLVSRLQWMEGYRLTRDDLRLIYPLAYSTEIETAAGRWKLPFEVFYGLVRTESAFIPDVASNVGAIGLAQLMPATAKDVARRIGRQVPISWQGDVPDLKDPETNAELGAWFLSDQSNRLGSPMLALLAYNGGPSRVRRWRAAAPTLPEDILLESVPIDETRNYGKKVLAAAAVYGYLYSGRPLEAVVSDILPHLR